MLYETTVSEPGVMGNIDHRQGAGLRCDPRPNRACLLQVPLLSRWRRTDFCGHADYTEMFQNCAMAGLYGGPWKSGDGLCT